MVQEHYHRWHTPHLSREFEMLVFGHSGLPLILFPTSKGRYYQNKDSKLIDVAAPWLESGKLKIYCPDSIDGESWYNYGIHPGERVRAHIAYDRLILNEVLALASKETGHDRVVVAGCSFGGYHAANIAFKYPEKVRYLVSLSGAFDIKQFIFGHYDDDAYFNNPVDYLPGLHDVRYLTEFKKMGIILGTGPLDSLQGDNHRLSKILSSKGIPHWLDDREGFGHDWPWWRIMFYDYLSIIFARESERLQQRGLDITREKRV